MTCESICLGIGDKQHSCCSSENVVQDDRPFCVGIDDKQHTCCSSGNVLQGIQTSPGAGLSATRGGADSPTPFTLYENSWCPGPLVTPLLAKDARSPERHYWTRSMATYTFAHLLSENYLNCTLTQILQAWNAMPKVYEGTCRGTKAMIKKRQERAIEQLREHMGSLKDLLQGVSQVPTFEEFRVITNVVLKNLAQVTFGTTEAMTRVLKDCPTTTVRDGLEAMQTRSEFDERLSVPIEAILHFTYGSDKGSVGELLGIKRTDGKKHAVALRYYRCPWTFHIQTKAPTSKKNAEWVGPFECNSVLAARSGWVHSQRSKNSGKAKNVWQCGRCAGDWMRGRHGTRMVQVITHEWMLQLILDEPPERLENEWRAERIKYYRRVEPMEAPRDSAPYLPPKSQNAKALRLEGEASNRMWQLLLKDEELDDLRAAQHTALLEQSREKAGSLPTADEISEDLLRFCFSDDSDIRMDGQRIEKSNVWVEHRGPGRKGHHTHD